MGMHTDLFSCLDRFSTGSGLLMIIFSLLFLAVTPTSKALTNIYCKFSDFDTTKTGKLLKAPLFPVFFCLLTFNLLGLTPYIGTPTRTLWFPLILSFSLWLAILASDFIASPKYVIGTLAPGGAPIALTPLLVIIETISILIRPVSLAVRLIANIRAGHIIIRLIAKARVITRTLFTFFEFFVSLVQSCIFVILLFTYNLNN